MVRHHSASNQLRSAFRVSSWWRCSQTRSATSSTCISGGGGGRVCQLLFTRVEPVQSRRAGSFRPHSKPNSLTLPVATSCVIYSLKVLVPSAVNELVMVWYVHPSFARACALSLSLCNVSGLGTARGLTVPCNGVAGARVGWSPSVFTFPSTL